MNATRTRSVAVTVGVVALTILVTSAYGQGPDLGGVRAIHINPQAEELGANRKIGTCLREKLQALGPFTFPEDAAGADAILTFETTIPKGSTRVLWPAAREFIDALQPYHRGAAAETDPLWILQDLNNTDKHRLIPVTVVGLELLRARDSADDITYADLFTVGGFGALQDGDVLVTIPKGDLYINAELVCGVAFQQVGASENQPIIPLLAQLIAYTSVVVEKLRAEFPR